MNKVIDKIESALKDIISEGIRPALLIINTEDERLLFTENTILKSDSAEDFFMTKYHVELMVIVTKDKKSEPGFYGNTRQDNFTA